MFFIYPLFILRRVKQLRLRSIGIVRWLMNGELKAIAPNIRYCVGTWLEVLRKNTKNVNQVADLWPESLKAPHKELHSVDNNVPLSLHTQSKRGIMHKWKTPFFPVKALAKIPDKLTLWETVASTESSISASNSPGKVYMSDNAATVLFIQTSNILVL